MVLLGVVLGLGLMLALPFWLGHAGLPWWTLVFAAFGVGLVGSKPITTYNAVCAARRQGRWAAVVWLIVGPFAFMGALMVIPYLIGRWVS